MRFTMDVMGRGNFGSGYKVHCGFERGKRKRRAAGNGNGTFSVSASGNCAVGSRAADRKNRRGRRNSTDGYGGCAAVCTMLGNSGLKSVSDRNGSTGATGIPVCKAWDKASVYSFSGSGFLDTLFYGNAFKLSFVNDASELLQAWRKSQQKSVPKLCEDEICPQIGMFE